MNTDPASTRLRRAVMAEGELPASIVGVHNALVARLAGRAGFDGGWLSSLEVSSVNGLPDRNLLGFGEMLATARSVMAASDLPLIVDADNGYGTIEATVRAVREFSSSGVAGVCIEDNAFPKQNSFIGEGTGNLEPAEAFAEKIAAAKAAQVDPDFIIIARTEALIRKRGMEEGLARAQMYADAGADMVLMHSKVKDGSEAIEAAKRWSQAVPLVTVPTMFPHLTLQTLGDLGYRLSIYANQLLRAAIWNMEQALVSIRSGQGIEQLEHRIVPMTELLALSEDFRSLEVVA